MPPAIIPYVATAIAGAGLIQGNNAAKSARDQGRQALAPQIGAQSDMLQLARNYNPKTEDAQAIAGANTNAAATLKQSLQSLNGNFLNAGGSPTGDTAFNVSATNMGNRSIDPLRAFTTQLLSTETQRKADMLGRVFGAPAGQMANSYFNLANGFQGDANNSLGMFIDGLRKMPWFTATGPGMGGGQSPFNYGGAGTTTSPQTDENGNPLG